jgi:type II secretion system protein J
MRRNSGFTLLELILTSSVSVIVLAGAYACLEAGLRSERLTAGRGDAIQGARVALGRLAADLRAACRLSKDFEFVGMDRRLDGMDADNIDFGSHHHRPRRAGEADFCEVSWFVDRDLEEGGYGLFRRVDASPDDRPLEGGTKEEVLPGLRGFQLEFYDGFRWYEDWGNQESEGPRQDRRSARSLLASNLEGLPEAVRITLKVDGSPPRRDGGKQAERAADRSAQKPEELTFRTTVRLFLAGRASTSAGDAAGGTGGATSGGAEGGPPAGQGG